MDAILLTVTGISLALAAGMGVLLARMLRDEHRRSDARVALLSELAAEPGDGPAPAMAVPLRPVLESQERPAIQPKPRATRSRTLVLDDFELHPASAEVAGVHDLFHEQDEPSPWPRRFAVIGGIAAMIALVVFGWSNLRPGPEQGTPPAAQAAAAPAEEGPLELLSLRHAQEDGMLTITGLVQNPRTGKVLSSVKATLFVFGPGGSFITSSRAPLDFTSLGPGDESPFVIRVPVSGEVARYRVGFRADDDRVLAHVDRRSADAIAQK
jgi:hypothetical protein